ncbi:hypothetical protein J2S43_001915 [Catenuloplanes nepalensis]|uniref:Polysaccharide lyase 14 domain-containing protein n=1 Tax=Catenuloplanes nepalensis TaxID=587533 RepID=A0ABT9MPP4_9ACTN|nr:hypothetical protein [Catenuloplanes nepalensis]MDP9793403.1 hypothetical protein [Catenuloplanes nepalensis]
MPRIGESRMRRAVMAVLAAGLVAAVGACAAPPVENVAAVTPSDPPSAAVPPPGFEAGIGAGPPSASPSPSPPGSSSPPAPKVVDGESVQVTDFERAAAGTAYGKGEWQSDGWSTPWELGMSSRAAVDAAVAHSGGKSLRVSYPAGQIGPEDSGAQAPFALEPRREYYVSQWIRLGAGFSFGTTNFAGKVGLGLAGGDSCSGGQACDGTNGFSSRLIWGRDGKAAIYYYSMGHAGQYGDAADLVTGGDQVFWPSDRWVNVVQRLRVNTVSGGQANADGEIEIWVDGARAAHVTGLRFVSNGDQVDRAYFSSFAGGGDATFAPRTDSEIFYDDLEIATGWPGTAAPRLP